MLTGIWAFQGKTVIDVRHQVLYGTPKPLAEMRKDPLPPQLQQIVDKALQKEPKNRYQKIAQMRDDLRAVLQQVAGAQMMPSDTFAPEPRGWQCRQTSVRTGSRANRRPKPSTAARTPSMSNPPSFAPDINSDGDRAGEEEYRDPAVQESKQATRVRTFTNSHLPTRSSPSSLRLKSLIVRPSSVIAKYQGKEVDPREAGRELRVHAVLSAGFLRAGEKLRVTAQLLDVLTGDIIWSDRIDAEGGDILTLQDRIAQRILEGLRLELSDTNRKNSAAGRPTMPRHGKNIFAAATISAGLFSARSTRKTATRRSRISKMRSILIRISHSLTAVSGACYANRFFKGLGEAEDYTHAETAFSKAFFYDPNVVEARVLMVMIYMARGEKKKARAEIELLQKQFPNEPRCISSKGVMHRLDGEYEESLEAFEKLSRLDPAARAVSAYNRARIFIYKRRLRQGDRRDRTRREGRARSPDAEDLPLGRLLLPRR